MPELRKCPKGHEYWWPSAKWQHDACFREVVADKPVLVADSAKSGGGQPVDGGGQPHKVVADRKADRHVNDKWRKAKEKWRKRLKRNPEAAAIEGECLMIDIAATIKEMH